MKIGLEERARFCMTPPQEVSRKKVPLKRFRHDLMTIDQEICECVGGWSQGVVLRIWGDQPVRPNGGYKSISSIKKPIRMITVQLSIINDDLTLAHRTPYPFYGFLLVMHRIQKINVQKKWNDRLCTAFFNGVAKNALNILFRGSFRRFFPTFPAGLFQFLKSSTVLVFEVFHRWGAVHPKAWIWDTDMGINPFSRIWTGCQS